MLDEFVGDFVRKPVAGFVLNGVPPSLQMPQWVISRADQIESTAQRKLRRRQLTEDGNVEISGPRFCARAWRGCPGASGVRGDEAHARDRRFGRLLRRQYFRYPQTQLGWPEGFWQQRRSRDAAAGDVDMAGDQ
jgi:hypothetical protein